MSGWHITIEMRMTHVFTVEAKDLFEAQATAMAQMPDRVPEKAETTIEVERGVK